MAYAKTKYRGTNPDCCHPYVESCCDDAAVRRNAPLRSFSMGEYVGVGDDEQAASGSAGGTVDFGKLFSDITSSGKELLGATTSAVTTTVETAAPGGPVVVTKPQKRGLTTNQKLLLGAGAAGLLLLVATRRK
jgi:hypothetical protein